MKEGNKLYKIVCRSLGLCPDDVTELIIRNTSLENVTFGGGGSGSGGGEMTSLKTLDLRRNFVGILPEPGITSLESIYLSGDWHISDIPRPSIYKVAASRGRLDITSFNKTFASSLIRTDTSHLAVSVWSQHPWIFGILNILFSIFQCRWGFLSAKRHKFSRGDMIGNVDICSRAVNKHI